MVAERHLVVEVHLHDARYHGVAGWPPAPGRLFQALVAGVGRGRTLDASAVPVLTWLEGLEPPTIAAPRARPGQKIQSFVPNNDADTLGGDLSQIGEIRTNKTIAPKLLDPDVPFLYVWSVDDPMPTTLESVDALAAQLYQFGRGVDMAWARALVLTRSELEQRLSGHPGTVHRPSAGEGQETLACPAPGTLASLNRRHVAALARLRPEGAGRDAKQLFSQPPKPHFVEVAYDAPPFRQLYELRRPGDSGAFFVWPLARVSALTERLRDGAADRLRQGLPGSEEVVERSLVGRLRGEDNGGPRALRVRIVPLPSIGHEHAGLGIRRVLVEVPSGGPLAAADVHWAFSGLQAMDPETGEIDDFILTPTGEAQMLDHYGVDAPRSSTNGAGRRESKGARRWRTVTPVVLPESARRRRIEPTKRTEDAKGGPERLMEEARAKAAVATALRHAGVPRRVACVRVQREPIDARGLRAEAFAPGTRFPKERLWHVELEVDAPLSGPLVIGDGRFLGLGLLAPVRQVEGVHAFVIESGLTTGAKAGAVTQALRRAVMARVHDVLGPRSSLPAFFSGHRADGSPARERHLTFAFDPDGARALVLAPHALAHTEPTAEDEKHLRIVEQALDGLSEVLAGSAGRLRVRRTLVEATTDRLFAASRVWESVTPYVVNRHAKGTDARAALAADLEADCRRVGLARPEIVVHEARGTRGKGLEGMARLTFAVAVPGPILLGRTRHFGGGLFRSSPI